MPSGTQFQCLCSPPFQGPTCADQDPCQPNPVSLRPIFILVKIYQLFFLSVKMEDSAFKWDQVLCVDALQVSLELNATYVIHALQIQ
jgi:hypothetical protein